MLVVNTEALKSFLNHHLGILCEADSGALTKYIMALLKKNRAKSDTIRMREFLCEQLEVFLLTKTPDFVDMLLEALKTKSYTQKVENKDESCGTKSSKNGMAENKSVPGVKEECHTNVEKTEDEKEKDSKKNTQIKKEKKDFRSLSEKKETPFSEACGSEHGDDIVDSSSKTLFDIPTVNSVKADYPLNKSLTSSYVQRCSDYDELGYCLKGSNCLYAHGFDAIPLNMEDLSTHHLNFNPDICVEGGSSHTNKPRCISPLCGLPPLPPTSPPLPPLPPPLPPPPSMLDAALGALEPYNPESPGMSAYYSTPRGAGMGSTIPSGPANGTNVYGSRTSEPFSHSKPQRTRELIGVPVSCDRDLKRKGTFDFSRLGPPKKFAKTDSVLELRKVPPQFNTIAKLNSHFSKFGKILNLEIAYDDDPESALVKFASPIEALNAYRSSGAIFNNRFIKVFYHSPQKKGILSEKGKYASLQGNVSRERTVFEIFPENSIKEEREVKVPFAKELELLRKKQDLLKNSIDHQKLILEKLMRTKNKKETEYLKKTIDTISAQISTLKSDIKKDYDHIFKKKLSLCLYGKKARTNKSEKEVLDAEMDSYKEKRADKHPHVEKETQQTESLLSEVNELKEKVSPDIVGDDEEEEDDDDSEGGRSWRRR